MIKLNNPKFKVVTLFISMIIFSFVFIWCITDVIRVPDENNISPSAIISTLSPAISADIPAITESPPPDFTPATSLDSLPPYNYMNMGSAKKLLGKCLFINIFLADEESSFSNKDKQEVMDKMEDMSTFFSEKIKPYNKDLTIIYNLNDLSIDYTVDFIIPTETKLSEWISGFIDRIYLEYDVDNLITKYDAENLAFFINVNKTRLSYASPYSYKHNNSYKESCLIFRTQPEEAAYTYTYAHEALHLFGAVDLYNLDDERLYLANEYFSWDIMLVKFKNIHYHTISNLTAYLIGWTDHLEEEYKIFIQGYTLP